MGEVVNGHLLRPTQGDQTSASSETLAAIAVRVSKQDDISGWPEERRTSYFGRQSDSFQPCEPDMSHGRKDESTV